MKEGIVEIFTADCVLTKMHNTAETSKESFKEALRSGLIKREQDIVLEYLKENQPSTARGVSYGCNIEKSNITRCLYNLVNAERVKVAFIEKCATTERKVQYYTLIDWVAEPGYAKAA